MVEYSTLMMNRLKKQTKIEDNNSCLTCMTSKKQQRAMVNNIKRKKQIKVIDGRATRLLFRCKFSLGRISDN